MPTPKKQTKIEVIRVRVTPQLKKDWDEFVLASGESGAIHLREALRMYVERYKATKAKASSLLTDAEKKNR